MQKNTSQVGDLSTANWLGSLSVKFLSEIFINDLWSHCISWFFIMLCTVGHTYVFPFHWNGNELLSLFTDSPRLIYVSLKVVLNGESKDLLILIPQWNEYISVPFFYQLLVLPWKLDFLICSLGLRWLRCLHPRSFLFSPWILFSCSQFGIVVDLWFRLCISYIMTWRSLFG